MDVLNVRNLNKDYEGRGVLNQVDLTIDDGEIVSLLGPSGCGKSTLLRIIAGLDDAYSGDVTFSEEKAEPDSRVSTGSKSKVGVVFQEPRLFPWLNVKQNIGFGSKPEPGQVEALAETVGLGEFLHAFPKQLSGGMAQRCAIARALLTMPRILLLDEPFSALDAFTRMHLHDLILEIRQSYTTAMLLVTHDIREALFLSDRVLVMSDRPGRITRSLKVETPWPRERTTDEMIRLEREILEEFGFTVDSAS